MGCNVSSKKYKQEKAQSPGAVHDFIEKPT